MKKCKDCGKRKPLDQFSKSKGMKDGRRNRCKECTRLTQKVYRANNPDKVQAWAAAVVAKGPAYKAKLNKQWKTNNPEWARIVQVANNANWKAKKLGVPGKITPDELKILFESFGNQCLVCGDLNWQVDHIEPFLNKDGTVNKRCTNTIDNVQPLCRTHNGTKQTDNTDYRPRKRKVA